MARLEDELDDAVNSAELEEVKLLIKQGADIEYKDPFGCTALMNASWVAASDIVLFLIELGADCSAKNKEKQTALDMARSVGHNDYGHDEVIKLLEAHKKI
jgi:ankyrin repeat protein